MKKVNAGALLVWTSNHLKQLKVTLISKEGNPGILKLKHWHKLGQNIANIKFFHQELTM